MFCSFESAATDGRFLIFAITDDRKNEYRREAWAKALLIRKYDDGDPLRTALQPAFHFPRSMDERVGQCHCTSRRRDGENSGRENRHGAR
ncbi:MAG TPA: hypothetical protein VFH71_06030 [Rhodanobacteraceae bacterium]|nr:hypothetical protein [Rhodanobacteraceae bacterium]